MIRNTGAMPEGEPVSMTPRVRWSLTLIAVVGLAACAVVIGGFLLTMVNNGLPWREGLSAGSYYRAVGSAYSGGFVAGFFFSFFLVLLAVVAAAWFDARRSRKGGAGAASAAAEAGGKVVAYRR
jgi:hypothetical protein